MTVLDGVLQGIIQGVTEFLPVSSSGHLALYQYFSGTSGEGALSFSLLLHLGTLLAVVIVFKDDVFSLIREFFLTIRDLFTGRFSVKNATPERRMLYLLVVATVPLILAIPIKGYIESLAEDGSILVEGICFLITASLLFFASRGAKGEIDSATSSYKKALFVGLAQILALFPGVSRSGSTMSAGLINGFKKSYAVKFSFLMGIPAILGGATLDAMDMIGGEVPFDAIPAIIGFISALVVGIASIKLLQYILKSDKLIIFAYYTLALGICVTLYSIWSFIVA